MSFPRYPAYKDSGVEWLGQVPTHWTIKSIKWLSPVLRGASPRPIDDPKYFDDTGEYAWVRIADSSASPGVLTETTQRLSELGSSLSVRLEPGELFVSIAGTVGKPCITAMKACIHDGFVYFPRLKIDPKFLFRVFEAGVCYAGLGKMGTQLNLNTDTIGSIRVALPPPDELPGVLSFIDRETAKIDALVAEQEELITLLKEKRQAVISHAVTKGLDPSVPMKDSGVEWLGEVPVHWNVKPLRYCVDYQEGPGILADDFRDEGVPLLRVSGVQGQWAALDGCNYLDPEKVQKRWDHFRLSKGDLLISASASMGTICEVGDEAEGAIPYTGIIRMRGRAGEVIKDFLRHMVVSRPFLTQIDLLKAGATIQHYGPTHLSQMFAVCPPEAEQEAISDLVDKELAQLGQLGDEASRVVRLLQERRSALISAAVTGQIDVRGLAPAQEQAA